MLIYVAVFVVLLLGGSVGTNMNVAEPFVAAEGPSVDQPLDKLTALEMLQLLKEYKVTHCCNGRYSVCCWQITCFHLSFSLQKRELLYVFQITTLQKELYLQQNAVPATPSALVYHNSQVALLDPAVNLEVRELRLRLLEKETELQKAKDELKASTFSADRCVQRRMERH